MKRIGKQTLELEMGCYIIGRGSLAGKKEKAEETITNGKYEYKHPNLKLIFEDGNEVEAWISARNTIGFYKPSGAFYEYARENSAD